MRPHPSAINICAATPQPNSTEPRGLTKAGQHRLDEAKRRFHAIETFRALLDGGMNKGDAAKQLDIDHVTLWRWVKQYDRRGFDGLLPRTESCGRKPALDLPGRQRTQLNRWLFIDGCEHAEVKQRLLDRFGLQVSVALIAKYHREKSEQRQRLAETVKARNQVNVHVVVEKAGSILAAQLLPAANLPFRVEVSRG